MPASSTHASGCAPCSWTKVTCRTACPSSSSSPIRNAAAVIVSTLTPVDCAVLSSFGHHRTWDRQCQPWSIPSRIHTVRPLTRPPPRQRRSAAGGKLLYRGPGDDIGLADQGAGQLSFVDHLQHPLPEISSRSGGRGDRHQSGAPARTPIRPSNSAMLFASSTTTGWPVAAATSASRRVRTTGETTREDPQRRRGAGSPSGSDDSPLTSPGRYSWTSMPKARTVRVTGPHSLGRAHTECALLGLGGSRGDGLLRSPVHGPHDTAAPGSSEAVDRQQRDAP